ncbi:MAG: damage-control phosphatase ARMT1 family protein [Candidatus Thorarchaeota archaeon SMTZ1-83]|nr:MAG: hypothetical protein AM324_14425 [Candidatus Thorarchaeota archaeon SMTZ1-83]
MSDEISVPLVPECSACMIESLRILIPLLATEEKEQYDLYSFAFSRLAEGFSKSLDPIEISVSLYRGLYNKMGVKDPYSSLKKQSVEAAKKALPPIDRHVSGLEGSEKLRAALAASIAGNVIDFNTAGHDPNLNDLRGIFEEILESGFAIDDSSKLWESLKTRRGKLLFLGDNAGETLFDIPLVRLAVDLGWDVTYVVKMRPMVNDAVEEDVRGTELEKLATIDNTGAWAHGVPKKWVSDEFLRLVADSNLVISKGQANIETFPEIQREFSVETYYVLRGKCPHISAAVGASKGQNVVLRRPGTE